MKTDPRWQNDLEKVAAERKLSHIWGDIRKRSLPGDTSNQTGFVDIMKSEPAVRRIIY